MSVIDLAGTFISGICVVSQYPGLSAPDASDMHSSSVLARHRVDGIGGGHGCSPSALLSRHISDPRGVSASENRPWADIERIKLYLIFYSFVSLHSLWTLHATQHPDPGLQPACVHPGGPGERAEARTPRGRRPIPLDLHASGHGTAPRPSLCQTPDRLLEPRALPPLATSGSHHKHLLLICHLKQNCYSYLPWVSPVHPS